MAHSVKHNSLLKILLSVSAHYSLALFVIVLYLLNSLAEARGEDVGKLKALQIQTAAYPQPIPLSNSLAQASTTPSPQQSSTPPTPSESEPEVMIAEVVVNGVEGKLEDEAYKAIISTRPRRTTTRSKLQEDVNAIFATGWFKSVDALPEDTPLGVRVTFKVEPNPVLRMVQVQGIRVLPQQVINNIFQKQYGTTLNIAQLQRDIQQIGKWYQDNGYTQAEVNVNPGISEDGLVTLQVSEGVIDEVVISGIEGQIKDILYGAIETKPGTIFNQSQVQKDTGIIYSYGAFSNVRPILKDKRLTFEVELNPVLRSVKVAGNQAPPQSIVDSIFSDQYGVVLSWQSLERGIEKLNQWYQESDYSFARIAETQPLIIQPKVKDGTVILTVSEGKIKNIQVRFLGENGEVRDEQGKPIPGKTPISAILQEMESKPEEAFRRDTLVRDLQRIFSLGLFQDVRVSLDYERDSNQVAIKVDVIEKPDDKSLDELGVRAASRQQAIVADVTRELGLIYEEAEEYQKAQIKLQESLQIYRATNEQYRQGKALNGLGRVHYGAKEYLEAIAKYQDALQIFESIGNRVEQAGVLNNLSNAHEELGGLYEKRKNISNYRNEYQKEYQLALESRRKSLSIFQELKTINHEVEAFLFLNTIGNLYKDLKEYQQALDTYQQALRLLNATAKQSIQATHSYDIFEDFTSSSTLFSDKDLLKGFVLMNLGDTYQRTGNYQQALYALHSSLSLMQSTKQNYEKKESLEDFKDTEFIVPYIESLTGFILSQVYADISEPQQSKIYYEEARRLASKIGNENAGNLWHEFFPSRRPGQNFDEVEGIKQSRSFWAAFGTNGDTLWRIVLASKIAQSEELDDKQQAYELYNQALSQIAEDNKPLRAITLNSAGDVLVDLGKPQEAITLHQKALELWQKLKERRGEAATLSLLGKAFSNQKQYDQALGFYNRALQMQRESQDSSAEADTHYGIAALHRSRGNFAQARKEIEVAIEITESHPTETETGLNFRIESLTEDFKTFITGQLTGTNYAEIINAQPLQLNSGDYGSYINLASYLEPKQKYYEFYIDSLMQQHQQHPDRGYDIEALEVSERSRGRSLQTFLNAAKNSNGTQVQNPSEQSSVALNQPLKLVEIQKLLDQDTLLLEYSLGKERSYLWVVSRDEPSATAKIKSYVLPRRKEIEQVARRFYDFLTVPSLRVRPNKTAQAGIELSKMILSPANEQLKQQRLLVAGDGILQYIPFSALPIPPADGMVNRENLAASTKPLLVNHEVVNLPSASVLALIRQRPGNRNPAPRQLAVFADPVYNLGDKRLVTKPGQGTSQFQLFSSALTASNGTIPSTNLSDIVQLYPRLEGFRRSAERILALVPESERRQLFDFDANLQNATSPELRQYRIVHFETHGVLDNKNPEKSGVILSTVNRDGELQMGLLSPNIVFNMHLPADLIVLSGCRTGLGKQIKGEGLTGLTSSFMYAGAERVVVSLWSVEDRATSELMTRFYQAMLQERLPAAQALRKAQLSMLQEPQWQLPYYWAAFTLQGEWK